MTDGPQMTDDRWLAGDAYERFMGRWSRPLASVFLDWLQPPAGARWLDVGCGTGALTAAICAHCDPRAVVACDPSEPFIAHARQTLPDPRATFTVAAADALPAVEGGFETAVSGLVLNFVPDPAAALEATRDRLAPGGVAAVYVWDYAEGMEFLRAFWETAAALDPAAAVLDEGRRFEICSAANLATLFETAGFTGIRTAPIEIATTFESFDDYWTPFLRGTGPAPAYVASRTPEQREQLRDRLRARLAPAGGYLDLRARAWAARGTR
jgi:trans-aconitate methyltransferase